MSDAGSVEANALFPGKTKPGSLSPMDEERSVSDYAKQWSGVAELLLVSGALAGLRHFGDCRECRVWPAEQMVHLVSRRGRHQASETQPFPGVLRAGSPRCL